ncbi:SRPBCC family protein, partial [Paracraurococcus ruber]
TAAARPSPDAARHDLLSHAVTARIAVPPDRFAAWFAAAPLERLLPGTADLPGVTGTAPLGSLPFPEPGARRLVCLADGGTALEEVLAHLPGQRLAYMVWDYSTPAARPIEYGMGEFRFAAEAGGTRVDWRYAFALRQDRFPGSLGALGRGLFRLAFLDTRYARFMAAGMAAIEREALAAAR